MSVKSDFAFVYSQWEKLHNEDEAITKRINSEKTETKTIAEPTVNELKRMKVQDELDLHDFTVEEALKNTRIFWFSAFFCVKMKMIDKAADWLPSLYMYK